MIRGKGALAVYGTTVGRAARVAFHIDDCRCLKFVCLDRIVGARTDGPEAEGRP
jgi:hypothetical protein